MQCVLFQEKGRESNELFGERVVKKRGITESAGW